jgi:hypothetical protein
MPRGRGAITQELLELLPPRSVIGDHAQRRMQVKAVDMCRQSRLPLLDHHSSRSTKRFAMRA